MDLTQIGVIGCGYWGPNLLRNFMEIPSSNVKMVADIKQDRLDFVHKSYPGVQTTADYHDLFSQGLDAVVIATPPETHFAIAKECFENGLHVLVEKPMTRTSREAEELMQIAKKHQRILMVGHTFEYNSAVHALKTMIKSGDIGDVYYIDTARLNLGLFRPELNVMWDLAPHDVSILMYILDMVPISVSAYGIKCIFQNLYDVVYMNLLFPNGLVAHIHTSWIDPCKVRRVTVVGSKKMVVYNDIEANEKIRIYDKGVDVHPYPNSYADFQCSYRYGDLIIPNIRLAEPLRQECNHFLECIRDGNDPWTSGEDGLRVIKILEAAERSLVNGAHQETIVW